MDNVAAVMTQLLKVQTKMETLREKLVALGTTEADEKLSCNLYLVFDNLTFEI